MTAWNDAIDIRSRVTAIALSDRGTIMAVAYDEIIKIWEIPDEVAWPRVKSDKTLNSSFQIVTPGTDSHRVFQMVLSRDGNWLACTTTNNKLRAISQIWDVKAKRLSAQLSEDPVAFSTDGRWLATREFKPGDYKIKIWESATGELLHTCEGGHHSHIRDIAFSPDGKVLASCGDDHRVRLWDTATGKLLRPTNP
jgi:WD40 repeat protein